MVALARALPAAINTAPTHAALKYPAKIIFSEFFKLSNFTNKIKYLQKIMSKKCPGATFGNISETPIFPLKSNVYKNHLVQNLKSVALNLTIIYAREHLYASARKKACKSRKEAYSTHHRKQQGLHH